MSFLTYGAVTPFNVWDLPLYAWQHYVIEQDAAEERAREANRRGQ